MSVLTASPTQGLAPADDEELSELFARWHRRREMAARDALVRHFTPLARSLARRYDRSSEPFEDLLQVALLGLLKALDRYNPELGHPFGSFAVPTILGEMRRYFRDSSWSVHVPRAAQERALRVRHAQERLTGEGGRSPTVNQIAEYLELSTEEILDALLAICAYEALPLDAPRPGGDEENSRTYSEALGRDDERYELVELDATVVAALEHVGAREREVLRMRFVEDLTQSEIAARIGISQMQVSRVLRGALDRLRTLTRAQAIGEAR